MASTFPTVSPYSKAFGAALKQVMKDRGVTQAHAAEKAGVLQSYVSERLAGKRAVDTDVIYGVAVAARVSPRTIVQEVHRQIAEQAPHAIAATARGEAKPQGRQVQPK